MSKVIFNPLSKKSFQLYPSVTEFDSRYLKLTGGTLTGDLLLGTHKLQTAVIYPSADSTTAVQINKANGTTNVLNIDTSSGRVGIGTLSSANISGTYSYGNGAYGNISLPTGGNMGFNVTRSISDTTPTFIIQNAGATATGDILQLKNNSSTLGVFSQSGNLGIGTKSPTNILSLGGNSVRKVWMERHTTADTAGNSLTLEAGGATVGATNKNGGDLIIKSGLATGTGYSSIKLQVPTAGSTGTADASFATLFEMGNNKIGFFGTTAVTKQTHIVDADGTLADLTTKFNALLLKLENYGLLATT